MRYIIYTLLLVCSCNYKEDSLGFLLDENDNEPSEKVKEVIKGLNFYVVYYQRPERNELYKIFGMKKEVGKEFWYKIDVSELEYTKIDDEVLFIDYVIRKPISEEEAKTFIKKLVKYGLFKLKRGKELTAECAKSLNKRGYPETSDTLGFNLHIYSDSLALNRDYYNPFGKYKNCPDKAVWKNILSIDSLFQNDWIKFRNPKIRL